MSWQEVAELHQMGFEIGNHSWSHSSFAQPKAAAALAGELGLVEWELRMVNVPKPVSFAWCGNGFGPEAVKVLERQGYKFARRGNQPEVPPDGMVGPAYNPEKHHPLLIPSTAISTPDFTLEHFKKAVNSAGQGEIVILQFHGVPDIPHPWVNTSQEKFRQFMQYLKENNFKVIALRDVEKYLPETLPDDPLLGYRHILRSSEELDWPTEILQTRSNLKYWLENSDWQRNSNGSLSNTWLLPNKMTIGTYVKPFTDYVEMELWLKNESGYQSLTHIKSQVCIMFTNATQFDQQTNENKIFDMPVTAVKSEDGKYWILTAWNLCGRAWGNEECPCMHSDPCLPVCPAGDTVRTTGRIWFYQGENIHQEIEKAKGMFTTAD